MHSTCYLCSEQQFCPTAFSQVFVGRKPVSFNQLLTFPSFSLCYSNTHSALGSQSPAEMDFHLSSSAFISRSLILYSTILPFCSVHPYLYCKLTTRRSTRASLELKDVGVCPNPLPVASKGRKLSLAENEGWIKERE